VTSGTITVGTLNVCGLPPRPPLWTLARRAPELCRRLEESSIDVLNVQEVFHYSSLRLLREGLRSYPYEAYRRGFVGPAGGLVTFSRLPLGHPSYRSFLGTYPTSGHARFRLRRAAMGAIQGILTVPLLTQAVTMVNTHLTANSDDDYSVGGRFYDFQRAQLVRLNQFLARQPRPGVRVITGDFNLPSTSDLYPLIVAYGAHRDPFATTNPCTYHPAFLRDGVPALRVDYLLVDGDEHHYPILDARTLFDEPIAGEDGTAFYLSDHIGLTVQIGLSP
jgi:endonuclease/exonuclease/phosphatase family metal-dependent hydrolase